MIEAILTKKPVHGNVEFVKDWTPLSWIAYGSLGTTAILTAINAAAKENSAVSNWLSPFLKIYLLGYGPAIFLMIATLFFIIDRVKSRKVTEIGKTTTALPMPTPVLSITPVLAKPKKFYSERNKSDLANALTDLSEMLNNDGLIIIQKAQEIVTTWNDESRSQKLPNFAVLIDQLNEVGNLANTLYQNLYHYNGFLKKHAVYSDELCPILQTRMIPSKTPNIPNNSIPTFQGSINGFRNVLSSILPAAEKYNDRNLIFSMLAISRQSFDDYIKGIRIFKEWFDETQKRIAAFRNSQLN
ncbi:MAG: hypothetical protein NTY36_02015 [Deltaproteobacteria bacterium]|nr:hypothetical protein [Deltaproteobacteria bacterium]